MTTYGCQQRCAQFWDGCPVHTCAALLCGCAVRWAGTLPLILPPACLPQLALQVAGLTNLRSLELCGSGFPLASAPCGAVVQLTVLTRLCLRHFSNLPRPLVAALPALRHSLLSLQLISLRGEGKPVGNG